MSIRVRERVSKLLAAVVGWFSSAVAALRSINGRSGNRPGFVDFRRSRWRRFFGGAVVAFVCFAVGVLAGILGVLAVAAVIALIVAIAVVVIALSTLPSLILAGVWVLIAPTLAQATGWEWPKAFTFWTAYGTFVILSYLLKLVSRAGAVEVTVRRESDEKKKSAAQIAADYLRRKGMSFVTAGDAGLLHDIADLLGTEHEGWKTERKVLNRIDRSNRGELAKWFTRGNSNNPSRVFSLPEHAPKGHRDGT